MKTRPDKPNDDKHEELRQQLWELAYGLLEPHEESALIARVKSDPALARLYAEVKLQTDLVSTAARVEDSSLSISAQGSSVGSTVSVNKEKRSAAKSSSRAVPAAKATGGSFGTNWLAVVGTTALLLLLGYGLWQPEVVTTSVAQGEFHYTRVTGLAAMTEGVTQTIGVEYQDIHNHGQATEFDVRLVDEQGQETYRTQVKTADNGRAEVDLPGVVLKKGVRLEVAPAADRRAGRDAEVISTELQVADENRKTVLLTERPRAEPGESNRFQIFGVGEYTKSITTPATDELMVQKQSGGDVVQPMWTVDPSNGVINGEYRLPKTYAGDDALAMRRRGLDRAEEAAKASEESPQPMQAKAQLRRTEEKTRETLELQKGLNGVAKAGLGTAARAKAGNAERDEQPSEGGRGAAFGGGQPGLARSQGPAGAAAAPPGPPAAPAPQNVAPAAQPDGDGNRKNAASAAAPGSAASRPSDKPLADAAPAKPGAALNAPAPAAPAAPGETQPKEAEQQKDAQVAKQEKVVAPAPKPTEPLRQEAERLTESKKQALGARKTVESLKKQEFEVEVPARMRGEDLVLIARSGGKTVVHRELKGFQNAEAKVDLPPEVSGLVEVELFRKDQPEAPIRRQQLVRASARSLNFEISGLKDSYAPGEEVQLSVRVVDELGRPAAGAASVRVWSEVAARAAGTSLLLVDSLSQDNLSADTFGVAMSAASAPERDRTEKRDRKSALENETETETVEKHLGTPLAEVSPAPAPTVPAAASEVFFVDNRSTIEQQYDRAVAIQEMQRAERMQSIGRVLMWSGAALMLLIGVLLIARRPLKSGIWIPAVGLAALSLVLGVVRFLPQSQPAWQLAKALPDETAQVPVEPGPGTLPVKPVGEDVKSASVPELPLPSNAPTAPLAPSDPAESKPALQALKQLAQSGSVPTDPTAAAPNAPPPQSPIPQGGGGQGSGQVGDLGGQSGATYGAIAERKQNPDEQAKRRLGEARGGKNNPGELQSPAGVDAAGGESAAKKSDGNADRRAAVASDGRDQLVPDSLFWRPLSPIDQDATFTIEFTMPAAESDYRLLIDAIGSGRIGGKEQILRCRAD